MEHKLHFMKHSKGKKGIPGKGATQAKARCCECEYGVRTNLRSKVHLELELCGVVGTVRDEFLR